MKRQSISGKVNGAGGGGGDDDDELNKPGPSSSGNEHSKATRKSAKIRDDDELSKPGPSSSRNKHSKATRKSTRIHNDDELSKSGPSSSRKKHSKARKSAGVLAENENAKRRRQEAANEAAVQAPNAGDDDDDGAESGIEEADVQAPNAGDDDDDAESGIQDDLENSRSTYSDTDDEQGSEGDSRGRLTYLEMVERNKELNMMFLESLNMAQLNKEIRDFLDGFKPKRNKYRDCIKKKIVKDPTPARRSLRLQNLPSTSYEESKIAAPLEVVSIHVQTPKGPLSFNETALENYQDFTSEFLEEFHFLSKEKPTEPAFTAFSQYESHFRSMLNDASLVAKVVLAKVHSIAIHPCDKKILVAAGSSTGQIGFWDVESKADHDGIFRYEPHIDRVSCLEFSPYNLSEIYSASFDGTFRCGDLQKGVFDEVYRIKANEKVDSNYNEACSFFDFLSPHSFLVGNRKGNVAVVDKRTGNIYGEKHHVTHCRCNLKTISVHPFQQSYFIAAGSDGVVSLWDIRHLKKTAVKDMYHLKSVNSAFFSPINGNYILTTCMDHHLRVFDSSSLTNDIAVQKIIGHDNFTGRWLTPFRAVWLPYNDEAFVIGSMNRPRCIETFEITGKLTYSFKSDCLNSVCSINAFHPSRHALAGGNSSGKVFVFKSTNE